MLGSIVGKLIFFILVILWLLIIGILVFIMSIVDDPVWVHHHRRCWLLVPGIYSSKYGRMAVGIILWLSLVRPVVTCALIFFVSLPILGWFYICNSSNRWFLVSYDYRHCRWWSLFINLINAYFSGSLIKRWYCHLWWFLLFTLISQRIQIGVAQIRLSVRTCIMLNAFHKLRFLSCRLHFMRNFAFIHTDIIIIFWAELSLTLRRSVSINNRTQLLLRLISL